MNKSTEIKAVPTENKAVDMQTKASISNEIIKMFEVFKQANDRRLQQIEKKMTVDPVTIAEIDKINQAMDQQKQKMDDLYLKVGRPSLTTKNGDDKAIESDQLQFRQAFENYIRKGIDYSLHSMQQKAMAVSMPGDGGGYLAPQQTETEIGRHLTSISPVRSIATVRAVSTNIYRKPFVTSGPAVGWVGETETRNQTDGPIIEELQFPTMELYAMPAATQTLLDDAAVNIDQWLAEEVQNAFARQEGEAFVNGNGVNKPKGFLQATQVAEAKWAWGKLGVIASGAEDGLKSESGADCLFELLYSLPSEYRQNACWIMNRQTQAEIRKLKDKEGNYIWQPSTVNNPASSLIGMPVIEAEAMPGTGAGATPIAFGDFRRGYLIVDRIGVRILRDPYSAKPYVLFYTTKRVGGGIQDYKAIKLLKCAVS